MSDPTWEAHWVRRAHGEATAALKRGECLASAVPTTSDVAVALARAGLPMPREQIRRVCAALLLKLADHVAERDVRRPQRG